MVKLVVGILIFVIVMKVGLFVLRALANPLPPPLPPGEMRRVNLRYRCGVCGVELKLTAAPAEEPAPPRHCLEDMELLTRAE